ncbi:MAG: hypothetical protein M3N45_16325 [Actinomycetota bacterium]|nr:hypothetical protein [Actinomycetota bacterium]
MSQAPDAVGARDVLTRYSGTGHLLGRWMMQDGRDEPGRAGRSPGMFDEEADTLGQIPTARALQLPQVGRR